MSIKVAESIGLLYKLSRFLPEIIFKTLYYSSILILWYIEAWHGYIKIIPLKSSFSRRKPYLQLNLIQHTMDIPTDTSNHLNVTKYSNFLIGISQLQVSNYIFQLLHFNIDEEVESSLLIKNQIHSHNTRTNNQMSILSMNRSKTKHCVLHNGMITWNSLPDMFKVNVSSSMFKSKVRNFYLKKY